MTFFTIRFARKAEKPFFHIKTLLRKPAILLIGILSILAVATPQTQAIEGKTLLKVLDINVWSGLDYIGTLTMGEYESDAVREKRYLALVEQIKQLDPDVIGVHEANKIPGYARRLGTDIGCEVFQHVGVGGVRLGPVGLPWNLREGDAILVKKKLNPEFVGRLQLSGGRVGKWLTFHFADATQILGISITVNQKPLYVYATHWHASLTDAPEIIAAAEDLVNKGNATPEQYKDLQAEIKAGADWRLSEAEKTLNFIHETAGNNPVILMGDFNAEKGSREIQTLIAQGMTDTFAHVNAHDPGYTWDPATNLNQKAHYLNDIPNDNAGLMESILSLDRTLPGRIDYIFAGPRALIDSGQITVNASRVVMQDVIHGVHASDHYGIYSELLVTPF